MINGLGTDVMFGGVGSDTFDFNVAPSSDKFNRIGDFDVASDVIRLDSASFAGLGLGQLTPEAFSANTSGRAGDASDRIIHETDTGRLYFDSDGNGAAARVQFATVSVDLALTHADFVIFQAAF